MESVHISYSRAFARWQLVFATIVLLSFGAFFGLAILLLASSKGVEDRLPALGGMAVLAWLSTIMWQWVRYRYALMERYTLDADGVRIDFGSDSAAGGRA